MILNLGLGFLGLGIGDWGFSIEDWAKINMGKTPIPNLKLPIGDFITNR